MSSAIRFVSDNGAAVGTPARGTTRTYNITGLYWRSDDASDYNYGSFPVTGGYNSVAKYMFASVSGSYSSVSNFKFGHTTGTLGAGISLYLHVTSGYTTPTTGTAISGTRIDITTPSGIASSYQTLLLNVDGPEFAGSTSLSTSGATQFFVTQCVTTTGAAAGNSEWATFTLTYDES